MPAAPAARTLRGPFTGSAVLHAALLLALFVSRSDPPRVSPPVYKVDLVAAPAGPRQAGVVTPPAATPEPPPAPSPPAPTRPVEAPDAMPAPPTAKKTPPPRKQPVKATPSAEPAAKAPPAEKAPKAGGGPTGGRGTDVVSVRTQGIEFPYPGYLSNIVRQIALNFKPDNPNLPLSAQLSFVIQRDGSVTDVRFVQRSGDYAFDLEARGAVEAAGSGRSFGPLPDGWRDDVLPVVFSFDPTVLR
jgi:periplasmic protein TonB